MENIEIPSSESPVWGEIYRKNVDRLLEVTTLQGDEIYMVAAGLLYQLKKAGPSDKNWRLEYRDEEEKAKRALLRDTASLHAALEKQLTTLRRQTRRAEKRLPHVPPPNRIIAHG